MNAHLLIFSKKLFLAFPFFLTFNLFAQTTTPCAKYEVVSTNNICGCTDYLFRPYGLFMEANDTCGITYFKPDTVVFEIRNDSTAAIRGVFRTFNDWRHVRVDITMQKATSGTPRFELCLTGSPASVANQWRYFGAMTGTIQFDGGTPLSVSSRNGNFQVGFGANGQNTDQLGGSGLFTLSNGQRGGFGFTLMNPTSGSCTLSDTCIADATPPVFNNCPQNISLTTTGTTAVATWTAPTATDNCSTPSVTSNFASGATFPIGTTTVIYTALDAKNNTAECRFNITVTLSNPCANDITPPVISNCPQNISLTTIGTTAVATWTAPTATDNCSTPSVTSNFASGASFPIGTTTVSYIARDASNNVAECRFTVTVSRIDPCLTDVIPPVFSNCPQNISVTTMGTSAVAVWTPLTATDNCGVITITSNFAPGASFPVGTTTVIYTARDTRNNFAECRFNVIVTFVDPCLTDATPPVFNNCPQNINLTTTGTSAIATWTAPTATDNCTATTITSNFASGTSFLIGSTTVIYTARDTRNNASECRFNVVVTKRIGAAGNCTSYAVENTNDICGCPTRQWTPYGLFIETGGGCGEYYKADSVSFQINGDSSARLVGIFRTATWRPVWLDIQWAKTNQTQRRFSTCANDTSAAHDWRFFGTAQGNIQFDDEHPLSITNRSLLQLGISANGQNRDLLGASGLITLGDGRVGSINIVLKNPITGTCDIACVNDSVAPRILNCPKNITQLTVQTPIAIAWAAPSVRDDCSSPTLTTTHQSGSLFAAGETTVVYTAQDVSGNQGKCTFKVTITKAPAGSLCSSYDVENTNDICGCSANQWKPYALRIGANNCGEYFKADSVVFHVNGDSSAYLQGRFRSDTWQPVWVDVRFAKAVNRNARFELCQSSNPESAKWQYFGAMTGTIKFDNAAPMTVQSGSLLQIGKGANGQNTNILGGNVNFTLANGTAASFNLLLNNYQQFTCPDFNPCAIDETKPTFSNCPRDTNIVTTQSSAIVRWTAPTATDNCSTLSVKRNFKSEQSFKVGSTVVIYTARDAAGNSSQCQFTVNIAQNPCLGDTSAPVFRTCPANITVVASTDTEPATWVLPTATDNCSTPSVTSNFTAGQRFPIGTTSVVYTASDSEGNTNQCRFTVTVVRNPCLNDMSPPILSRCPDTVIVYTRGNSAPVTWTMPTATDNCSIPTVTSNFPSGLTFNLGNTIIMVRATDAAGNVSQCNFIVSVRFITAIEEPNAAVTLLKIAPNPVSSQLNLAWQSHIAEGAQLEISNVLGQVMIQQKVKMRIGDNQLPIDVSHLAKGVYHLTLRNPQYAPSKPIRFMKI